MTHRRDARDEGRVLVLILGVVVVLAMLVGVVVDAGRLYLARRSLDGVTDAAALAGAQSVDLGAVYGGRARRPGLSGDELPLDEPRVRTAVDGYLDDADVVRTFRGFDLTGVVVEDDEVTVATSATVRLPFVGPLTRGRSSIVVRSTSTARNRIAR